MPPFPLSCVWASIAADTIFLKSVDVFPLNSSVNQSERSEPKILKKEYCDCSNNILMCGRIRFRLLKSLHLGLSNKIICTMSTFCMSKSVCRSKSIKKASLFPSDEGPAKVDQVGSRIRSPLLKGFSKSHIPFFFGDLGLWLAWLVFFFVLIPVDLWGMTLLIQTLMDMEYLSRSLKQRIKFKSSLE